MAYVAKSVPDQADVVDKPRHHCSFPGCRKNFGKPSRLVVHERTHSGERPFVCPYETCGKSYTRHFHLTRHIAVSHDAKTVSDSDKSIWCERCQKSFTNKYSLKKHLQNRHEKNPYSCPICHKLFRKQQHLKTHSYQHTHIGPYLCTYKDCGKRFRFPNVLRRHLLSHVTKRYICLYESCNETFESYRSLRLHLSAHPKTCDICKLEFSMMSRLRVHLQSHMDSTVREIFFCPFTPCERYYFDEKNLQSHIRENHDTDFREHPCPICNKSLASLPKLRRHIKRHKPRFPSTQKVSVPRKPRKDKGISRTDYAKLLSGYCSDNEVQEKGLVANLQVEKIGEDVDKMQSSPVIMEVSSDFRIKVNINES